MIWDVGKESEEDMEEFGREIRSFDFGLKVDWIERRKRGWEGLFFFDVRVGHVGGLRAGVARMRPFLCYRS